MQIQLSHLIILLQTYDQSQLVEIADTDEMDKRTMVNLSFNNSIVPYVDMMKKLETLQQHT
jgi:hypothetical protein